LTLNLCVTEWRVTGSTRRRPGAGRAEGIIAN